MPKKKQGYAWQVGQRAPDLEAHSSAKHEILEGYLRRYLNVMFANPRRPKMHLDIVDGFCGGGQYWDPTQHKHVSGSPFIIEETLKATMAQLAHTRDRPPELQCTLWMVDNDPHAIEYLQTIQRDRDPPPGLKRQVIHGSFEPALPGLLETIKNG
ncbi:MAG: three-Cys-motif partner protein TcmP, partial [Algiphilus sp.]